MSKLDEVRVFILNEAQAGVASWHGHPPSVGDTVRVVVTGDGAQEPSDRRGTVVRRDWLYRNLLPGGKHQRFVRVECFVSLDWEPEP